MGVSREINHFVSRLNSEERDLDGSIDKALEFTDRFLKAA